MLQDRLARLNLLQNKPPFPLEGAVEDVNNKPVIFNNAGIYYIV